MRPFARSLPRLACSLLVGLALLLPEIGLADSIVRLRLNGELGGIQAGTYDELGNRVGKAELSMTKLENGRVRIRSYSGLQENGASQEAIAELLPVGHEGEYKLAFQTSEARDAQGRSLGLMRIDHRRRTAECGVAEYLDDEPVEVRLPLRDKVVNVPLNLLFQPLVVGEKEEIDFQFLLCRGGARIVDATARIADDGVAAKPAVEVRYRLDFGPILSRLAAPFMPRLSFWFDMSQDGRWLGHRLPLYSKGPTVMVVRDGFDGLVFGGVGN